MIISTIFLLYKEGNVENLSVLMIECKKGHKMRPEPATGSDFFSLLGQGNYILIRAKSEYFKK